MLLKIIPSKNMLVVIKEKNLEHLMSQIICECAVKIWKWLVAEVRFPNASRQTLIPVLARGQVKQ